jgi:NADH-ubiquinone oxidoreductase chain 5
MLLNRIGDFSLLIAIFLILINFKSMDYNTVEALIPFLKINVVNILFLKINSLETIGFFMFIGAIGKSAQIGLHTWLPDAMEGPTPVSALIHAATMVTAGVFLIIRACFIFEHVKNILNFITIIGTITAFFAATTGLFQNDIKRVVAYSTCSQLGYMVFACGLCNYSVGFFHLTNHAFFKALLFLSAGSIIHSVADEQDMRKMGGLKKLIPFTYVITTIGSLALIGFPYFTGFYSKDLILEIAYSKYSFLGFCSYCLGTIVAYVTAYYSMRLVFLTFLTKPVGYKQVISFACDCGLSIFISLIFLALPSILIGYYSKDLIVGLGNNVLNSILYINLKNYNFLDSEYINVFLKNLPVCFSILGFLFAYIFYIFNFKFLFKLKLSQIGKKIYFFLNRKWFFDKIYCEYIGQLFFNFAYSTSYKFIDKGIFEILGPTGFSNIVLRVSLNLNKLQTGYIYHYMSILLLFLGLFFCLIEV